jgi:hypothetical protein
MRTGLRVALAVGAGYLLGRRRKTQLALMLGAAAATGQLGKAPAMLGRAGTKALVGAGGLEPIMEPGGRLVVAAKDAAAVALTDRVARLTDRMRDQAQKLSVPDLGAGERGDADLGRPHDQDEDEYDEEPADDYEPEDHRYEDDEEDDGRGGRRDVNVRAEQSDEPRRVTRRRSADRAPAEGAPVRRRRS